MLSFSDCAEEDWFSCSRCEQSFASQARLVAHLRQVNQAAQAKNYCFVCDYRSKTFEDLAEHMQLLHPEEDTSTLYVCQICEENFKSEQDTICHLQDCGNAIVEDDTNKEVTIIKTKEEKNSPITLEETEKTGLEIPLEEGRNELENVEAVESISKDTQIKGDNQTNIDDQPNIGAEAKKPLQPTQNLHFKKYTDTRGFYLPESGSPLKRIFDFFTSSNLDEIKRGYKCPDCDRVYTTYGGAKHHLNSICNKEANQVCEICGYRTRQKSNLNVHMKLIHEAPDSYLCTKCNKRFELKRLYTHHVNYDCVEPRRCHLCDYETKLPGILKNHMLKVHNLAVVTEKSEGPSKQKIIPEPIKIPQGFKCPKCHKYFRVPDNYTKHYILSCSTKSRLSDCLVKSCGYKSNNLHNIKQHMMRKHRLFTKVRNNRLVMAVDTNPTSK